MSDHFTYIKNPPWVDEAIASVWERMVRRVPLDWLPNHRYEPNPRLTYKEYGCGAFGCVLPTFNGNVCLKVTKDEFEAYMVNAMLNETSQDKWPPNIVRFYKVYDTKRKHKGERIFFIWRDTIEFPGFIEKLRRVKTRRGQQRELPDPSSRWFEPLRNSLNLPGFEDEIQEFFMALFGFMHNSKNTVDSIPDSGFSGSIVSVPWNLKTKKLASKNITQLAETRLGKHLAKGLRFFLNKDMVIFDVHEGNIGILPRPGKSLKDFNCPERYVIFDVGQGFFVSDKYEDDRVPVL